MFFRSAQVLSGVCGLCGVEGQHSRDGVQLRLHTELHARDRKQNPTYDPMNTNVRFLGGKSSHSRCSTKDSYW